VFFWGIKVLTKHYKKSTLAAQKGGGTHKIAYFRVFWTYYKHTFKILCKY
jgi:hypothetical protein